MMRQFRDGEIAVDEFVALLGHEGIGNFLLADTDLDCSTELLDKRPQLLEQVSAKEGRLGDRRRIASRHLELRPGAPREVHRAGRMPVHL